MHLEASYLGGLEFYKVSCMSGAIFNPCKIGLRSGLSAFQSWRSLLVLGPLVGSDGIEVDENWKHLKTTMKPKKWKFGI